MVRQKTYLLDTCVCVNMLRGKMSVREKIKDVGLENCCVSEITIAELYYGAAKSCQERHYNDVISISRMFIVVPCFSSLRLFGDNKYTLERMGVRLDDFDLMIGSTAVSENMVMVTNNVKHFERIPDIVIENWR